jgi:hypothetical protein
VNAPHDNQLAATTVIDLSDHFSRLRDEAQRLQGEFKARERGFFTPSEDEQVLHLWVSYHKARGALLELIDSIRQAVGSASDECIEEFVIAYAAGSVLVDAARTLRDLFSNHKLVRSKLNESLQSYGIGPGSFDAIQMALTDPTNAVRLRQAHAFFDSRESSIREAASDNETMREVLSVIDHIGTRGRFTATDYIKERAVDRGREVKTTVSGGVSQAIYLIQELGSRLVSNITTIPYHVPRVPEPIQAEVMSLLQPGDVLVTRKENALTNYFLPGYWPHAAFYIGGERVIEALKDGVRERTMDSPLGNDAVAVIRPRLSPERIDEAIQRARTHVGKPYDFDFDFTRSDRLVCTEVVYRSLDGLDGMRFPLSIRVGRPTVSAEDLLNLAMRRQFFDPIAVYCPKHSDKLLSLPELTAVLQQTVAQA